MAKKMVNVACIYKSRRKRETESINPESILSRNIITRSAGSGGIFFIGWVYV